MPSAKSRSYNTTLGGPTIFVQNSLQLCKTVPSFTADLPIYFRICQVPGFFKLNCFLQVFATRLSVAFDSMHTRYEPVREKTNNLGF